MIKYQASVTAIGEQVAEFTSHGVLVLFGQSAPKEVADFSVLHDGNNTEVELVSGDLVWIGETSFRVLAVGDVVNKNLRALGHLVLKCNGQTSAELPGDVCVEIKTLPDVKIGMTIRVETPIETGTVATTKG